MPLFQDVLQAIVCFGLRTFDQVTDLEAFLPQLNNSLVVFGKDFTLSHLKLLEIPLFFGGQCLLFPSLGVDSLRQDPLLLLQVFKLLSKFLVLCHILLRLFNTDTVVLSYSVQLCQAVAELLELVNLLISELLGLLVLLLKFRQFLRKVGQTLCRVLDLL